MVKKSLLEYVSLTPAKIKYFDTEQKIDSSYIWDVLKYEYERDVYFLSLLGIHIE